jgi:hypothetical protein
MFLRRPKPPLGDISRTVNLSAPTYGLTSTASPHRPTLGMLVVAHPGPQLLQRRRDVCGQRLARSYITAATHTCFCAVCVSAVPCSSPRTAARLHYHSRRRCRPSTFSTKQSRNTDSRAVTALHGRACAVLHPLRCLVSRSAYSATLLVCRLELQLPCARALSTWAGSPFPFPLPSKRHRYSSAPGGKSARRTSGCSASRRSARAAARSALARL